MTAPPLPTRPALFIDFDGTLVDIAAEPGAVRVADGLVPLLARLQTGLAGALAVVSGRPIAELDGFLSPLAFAAAGLHGLERRLAPGAAVLPPPRPAAIERLAARLAARLGDVPGVLIEDKGATLAVHYRAAPERAPQVVALVRDLVAGADALALVEGKMVIEAKPRGTDKGAAVAAFLEAAPFAGRLPVFLGDDVTDEDGFAAVAAAGGLAVKVGAGPTGAAHRLPGVAAVHDWLAALADRVAAVADTARHDHRI